MRFSAKVSSYYLTHIDIDISIEIKIINQCDETVNGGLAWSVLI